MAGCNKFQHHQLPSNENTMKNISSSAAEARPGDVEGGGGRSIKKSTTTTTTTTTTRRMKKNLSNSNKRKKLIDLKVVYISTPMKVKTCASKFREIVQQLTGKYSDVARIMEETGSLSAQDDTYHYWTTEAAGDVNKLYNINHQDQDQDQDQDPYVRQITTKNNTRRDWDSSPSCSLSAGGATTTTTTEGSTTSSSSLILNNNNIADENILARGQFDHHRFMMDGPDHHHQYHSFMAAEEQSDDDGLLQGPFNFLDFLCDQNGPDPEPEHDHLVDVLPSF